MRFLKKLPAGFTSARAWLALAIMVAAYFLEDPVQAWLYAPLKHIGHLRMHENGAMSVVPYGALIHLGNPGVSPIWLARLCLQGMLLAYAVYRTQSVWWSIGYHTGWNWIGAPIFGSAGSGYLNAGHLYDFTPHGSTFITGGAVGPEGSVFAFAAVVAALVLLLVTTQRR